MSEREFIIQSMAAIAARLPLAADEVLVVTRQGRLVILNELPVLGSLRLLVNGRWSQRLSESMLADRIRDHVRAELV